MKDALIIFAVTVGIIALFIGITSVFDFDKFPDINALVINTQTNKFNECIKEFTNIEINTLEVKEVHLNTDKVLDAIITYTDPDHCGSGGCISELCVSNSEKRYLYTSFGFTSNSLNTLQTVTNGMHDLELNNSFKMNWDGKKYQLSE